MKKSIIFILLLFLPYTVQAEHYQWIENGIHHFSNCQKPPGGRGNFTFVGSPTEAQTSSKTIAEEKESEIRDTIKKIEDRNDKVKAIKETYFQPGADTLKNIMQLILPATSESKDGG